MGSSESAFRANLLRVGGSFSATLAYPLLNQRGRWKLRMKLLLHGHRAQSEKCRDECRRVWVLQLRLL